MARSQTIWTRGRRASRHAVEERPWRDAGGGAVSGRPIPRLLRLARQRRPGRGGWRLLGVSRHRAHHRCHRGRGDGADIGGWGQASTHARLALHLRRRSCHQWPPHRRPGSGFQRHGAAWEIHGHARVGRRRRRVIRRTGYHARCLCAVGGVECEARRRNRPPRIRSFIEVDCGNGSPGAGQSRARAPRSPFYGGIDCLRRRPAGRGPAALDDVEPLQALALWRSRHRLGQKLADPEDRGRFL